MSAGKIAGAAGTPLASPVLGGVTNTASAEKPSPAAKPMTEAATAAREFEAIFVRTMLRSTPLGSKSDAYTDLGVDALAKTMTSGRGLGLADKIREALEASERLKKSHGPEKS